MQAGQSWLDNVARAIFHPFWPLPSQWTETFLIEDRSVFSQEPRWTSQHVDEVYHAFEEHPDVGADDFITKLKGHM
jgi:hypothetical protein